MPSLRARLSGFILLASGLAMTALPASAQRMRTERVRFSRGTSEATVTSAPRPGRPVRYLVGVSVGQTLVASASAADGDADCYVQVYAPGRPIQERYLAPNEDGERGSVQDWSGRLSRSGDYQVLLINAATRGSCRARISVE